MNMKGITHSLVALRGQVKVVIHILMGDGAIGMNKAWVHTEKRGVEEGRHSFLNQLVYFGISLSQRIWVFPSWQKTLENRRINAAVKQMHCDILQ